MVKTKDFGLLYKFSYPPYQITSYSNNSFVVCGGGGAAKTGVPNKIELYELSNVNNNDPSIVPVLKNLLSFDSEDKAIMSLRNHFNYILTAEGSDICEYILCEKNQDDLENDAKNKIDEETVVKDRRIVSDIMKLNQNGFELKLHRKLESCFKDEGHNFEVTVIRYCDKSGHLIVAGGNNGVVKVFQRYNDDKPMDLVLQKEFKDVSSTGGLAVTELDVSPNLDEFVTVCDRPDGKYASVWSISRGVKVTELALMNPKGKKYQTQGCQYKFKHCRYARTYLDRQTFLLYTTHQPAVKNKKMPSFMSVWGSLGLNFSSDYQLIDMISLGSNSGYFGSCLVPTALSTSHCGFLTAIGSGEGQVDVYRLHSHTHILARIYSLSQAHSFFVTDLTFLPSNRSFKSGHQFELLSVGVDNMLRYHRSVHKPTYLRLERLYQLLYVMLIVFFCDRLLLLLSLF